jgi:Zn-dependent peptidase ImmA (M78 family)
MNLDVLREVLNQRRSRLSSLSRKTGIAEDRLALLAQEAEPSLKEWRLLSRALKLSTSALSEEQATGRYSFLFRSPVGGKRLSRALLSQLSSKMMISDELRPGHSAARIASFRQQFGQHQNYMDAEANARYFRKLFAENDQDRPLTDLPSIVSRQLGIKIFLIDTPGIEGASVVSAEDAFIFLARRFAPRMLFTLAHEVAHIFFHQSESSEFISVDFDSSGSRSEIVSRTASQNELYAQGFASALLMPDAAVGIVLKRYREQTNVKGPLGDIEINVLARFFGVSFLAAAVRCESLRLLPPGGAVSLDDKIKEDFGSAEKRATQIGLPDREPLNFPYFPEDLLIAAIEKIREGSMSIGRASAELGITVEDLISANEQSIH